MAVEGENNIHDAPVVGPEPLIPEEELGKSPSWGTAQRALAWINTIVGILIMVALIVGANVICNRYYLRKDITKEQSYRITDHTISVLTGLKKKVSIFLYEAYVNPNDERILPDAWRKIRGLLEEYKQRSDAIEVKNMTEMEMAIQQKTRKDFPMMSPNDILLVCEGRNKTINAYETFSADQQTGRIANFNAEGMLTTAIKEVVAETKPIVYFTTGHDELDAKERTEQSVSLLSQVLGGRENCDVRTVNLLTEGKVPAECALLCIMGPSRKFLPGELEMLKQYLERGGRMFVAISPILDHGLEEFLAAWGVRVCKEVIIDWGSVANSAFLGIRRLGTLAQEGCYPPGNPINARVGDLLTVFPLCAVVEPQPNMEMKIDSRTLVQSMAEAYAENDLSFLAEKQRRPERDEAKERGGPLPMLVAVESIVANKSDKESKKPIKTRLIVSGSTDFVMSYVLSRPVGNADYLLNCFRWLLEKESEISIPEKQFTNKPLEIKPEAVGRIQLLSMVVFPGFVVVIGIAVWIFRRK